MEKINTGIIRKILSGDDVDRFAYSPNYWQWFSHHRNHGILPAEIRHCESQLDLLEWLGVDIFSRNIYAKQDEYWFGGICDMYLETGDISSTVSMEGKNKVTDIVYDSGSGKLSEKLLYVFDESTIVQKKFLVDDYREQAALLEKFIGARKWKFNQDKFSRISSRTGDNGVVIVGDFFSPLKMLHLTMGPVN